MQARGDYQNHAIGWLQRGYSSLRGGTVAEYFHEFGCHSGNVGYNFPVRLMSCQFADTPWTSTMNELREIAFVQGQLVWSRYNAMIVAHAVLIGFLGQAAVSDSSAPNTIVVFGCVIGVLLALIWWRITSVGWSLMHAWLGAVPQEEGIVTPEMIYEKWANRFIFPRFQDSIWWCAHAVIAVFFVGYLLLFWYFAHEQKIQSYIINISIAVAVFWFLWLLQSSLRKLNIRD